jgi:hypothetical protein
MATAQTYIARYDPDHDFDKGDGNAGTDGDQTGRKCQAHPDGGNVPNIIENHGS